MDLRFSFLVFLSVAVPACTSSAGPTDGGYSGCPEDLPAACPTQVPSYQTTIAPVIANRCLGCHGDGGIEVTKHDLTSYADVYRQRSAFLNQVHGCMMPPASSPALTPVERKAVLEWLVCNAPNN